MPHPLRIQRKRSKGWKMPEGAVYVGRPTKWGNPFAHDDPAYAVKAFTLYLREALHMRGRPFGWHCPSKWIGREDLPAEVLIGEAYSEGRNNGRDLPLLWRTCRDFSRPLTMHQMPDMLAVNRRSIIELRGKLLACWCPLDRPCHADVLAELANR